MPAEARCGTWEVFENREARTGRKIPLHVVVLPATGPDRLTDPLVYFAGGPGDASIPEGLSVVRELASLRRKRDALLVDLRGTGQSAGLYCTELKGDLSGQGFLDDFLPADKVRACRDRLKKEVDLSWYTTDAAVDDVEEVRTALGYGPLNLIGGSYGTRAVLTYMRRHPRSVRTATLDGVVAPDARVPLGLARATQKALDGLVAECEGDAACRSAFPKLRAELDAVVRQVTSEPVRAELKDPSGQPMEVRLSRNGLLQTLRYKLYVPSEAAQIPAAIHEAAQGNWKPLAISARLYGNITRSMAEGFYLSVTCAEDVAFIRDEAVAPAVAGTLLGDFRIRQQKAACEGWPTRGLGPEVQGPVVSDVPTLLISGERDPATPAYDGERVARTLKHARQVVIPDAGHGRDGMRNEGCIVGLATAFIEAGKVEGLDTSCLAGMSRPGFVLGLVPFDKPAEPEVAVGKADLGRLVGSYTAPEMGVLLKVELVEDRLRLSVLQGPPFAPAFLIPTSSTRFRWEGEGLAPGLMVEFELTGVTGDGASALKIVQPGKPELVLARSE
jgi:pimeloyl-ACP methyl ester carboxylesterase